MLLSIQFPVADSRAFLNDKVKLLGRPTWPSASPYYDFVRSFGMIKTRRLGGLPGWVGENVLCEADRALRFSKIRNYKDSDSGLSVPLTVAFRRFYFDGLAVGKLEVGISAEVESLNRKQAHELIRHCLDLPVTIPALSCKAVSSDFAGKPVETVLGLAGKHFARFYAGSSISHPPPVKLEDWWVISGAALLFLIHGSSEKIDIPFRGKSLPRSGNSDTDFDLSYYEVPHAGRSLRMWTMGLTPNRSYKNARSLKICLLRLHAEHESLRLVLQNISTNKIDTAPRTNESNTLQRYLNEATRRVSRLGSEADHLSKTDLAEVARESEDIVSPGEREALLTTLTNLDVRRNIFFKIQDYVNADIIVKELYMDSKYKITGGNQGAVGDSAQASNNSFNTWNQSGGDLKELAKQLSLLRKELREQAQEPGHFESATAIAKAEVAAENGDGPTVFKHLKTAGTWALETASSIGVPVAIQAIKTAVGIG